MPANEGDMNLIPGLGKSPGGENGNLLQYSCLENSWTEEPGGLQSMGGKKVRYHLMTEQQLVYLNIRKIILLIQDILSLRYLGKSCGDVKESIVHEDVELESEVRA